jgi:hypothetical protein
MALTWIPERVWLLSLCAYRALRTSRQRLGNSLVMRGTVKQMEVAYLEELVYARHLVA